MNKPILKAFLAAVVACGLAACAAKPVPEPKKPAAAVPERKSRITPETAKDAQKIKTKRFTIYYFGTARGEYNADRSDWVGTVSGDVLYMDDDRQAGMQRRIQGPDVKMTVGHGNVETQGEARTQIFSALPKN
jgi:hypothetical protein